MKIRIEIEGKNAGSIYYRGPDSAEEAAKYLNSIEADELQISLSRENGTKAFAEFEGEFCGQSAIKFIMSASENKTVPQDTTFSNLVNGSQLTLKERLEMFLRYEYSGIWFSSLDVKKKYESVYGTIGLSTVSTYLARMYRDNILELRGNRNHREYRFKIENSPVMNVLALAK